jgi:ABC-2 type transport system permease protein
MSTVFRYTLARFRGQIIGWSIGMFLLALLIVPLYDVVVAQQAQFQELMESYPPEFSAFFGDIGALGTPEGYLGVEFFSLAPLILGVFAVLGGSGLVASDEEKGTLDLVLAHPVSRTGLFVGRLLAFAAALAIILLVTWLSFLVLMLWSSLDVSWDAMALPFLSLLGVLLCFGTLALLLSMLLPSRRMAAMMAGLLLVASYFLTSLARINTDLEPAARLSPLTYYQSGDAILGLNLGWFVGLLAVAALWALLAWWRFERRDIRVGGEGGWRFPALRRRRNAARSAVGEPATSR